MLRKATLRVASFRTVLPTISGKAFVYLDPPYPPLNGTANFTHYTSDRFGEEDQEALADAVQRLHSRGIPFMMTNADTPLIRSLYRRFHAMPVSVTRYVTCRAVKHPARELVIRNYI